MRTQILFLLFSSTLALHFACGSESEESNNGASSSSGGSSGASSSGAASSSGTASSSGSSGDDGGDSGPPPLITTCDAPVRVDTLRGVNGADLVTATSFGNKWAVTWYQAASSSNDGLSHFKGRVFDGTVMKDEQDLGTYEYNTSNALVSDGAGHAFAQALTSGSAKRYVVDFAAGTFGNATSFTGVDGLQPWGLAAIPGGGALSVFRDGTKVASERWLPADPTWKATDLAGSPSLVFGVRAFAITGGKGAALWYANNGAVTDISVAFFDGTNWSAPVVKSLAQADGALGFLEGGMYSNGDVLFVYTQAATPVVHTVRVHAADKAMDPVVDIGSATGASTTAPGVVIDPSDRVSIAYLDLGHAKVARNVGSGFETAPDLGPAETFRFDRDPTTNDLYLLTYRQQSFSVRGLPAAGTTWSPPVPFIGVGITSGMTLSRQTAMAFDSAGKPIIFSMHEAPGAGGLQLVYVKCK